MFELPEGAEAIVVKPDGITPPTTTVFRDAQWETAVSTGNWGKRASRLGVLHSKFIGEPFVEDGITKLRVVNETEGDYYTLQGVRVTQPQKGVYIQNGKKVIIK